MNELSFSEPESLECVRGLMTIGEQMWDIYSGDEVVDMNGVHLVAYPISVTKDGAVEEIGNGVFPDTKTLVRGKRSKMLPPVLTTGFYRNHFVFFFRFQLVDDWPRSLSFSSFVSFLFSKYYL